MPCRAQVLEPLATCMAGFLVEDGVGSRYLSLATNLPHSHPTLKSHRASVSALTALFLPPPPSPPMKLC